MLPKENTVLQISVSNCQTVGTTLIKLILILILQWRRYKKMVFMFPPYFLRHWIFFKNYRFF